MKLLKLIPVSLAALALSAQAREIRDLGGDVSAIISAQPSQLSPDAISYAYTVENFADWLTRYPAQGANLTPWKGYREPIVPKPYGGERDKKLKVFAVVSKAVIARAPEQVDIKKALTLDFVSKLTPELEHREISYRQVVPFAASRGPVDAFAWCNKDYTYFRTDRDQKSDYQLKLLEMLNPPAGRWCDGGGEVLCVESCYRLQGGWMQSLNMYNKTKEVEERKDLGIGTQSEIRYFANEAEMGMDQPISTLTGIDAPVHGILRQNLFFFNQVFEFGSVAAIFQRDPSDPNRTIVTSFVVFSVSQDTWNMEGGQVGNMLLGKMSDENDTGIMRGLPDFTRGIARILPDIF